MREAKSIKRGSLFLKGTVLSQFELYFFVLYNMFILIVHVVHFHVAEEGLLMKLISLLNSILRAASA